MLGDNERLPSSTLRPAAAAALWLAACALGFAGLAGYQSAAGAPGAPPESWPAASALRRSPGHKTLLVFAHPSCPCTRATMDSLAWVMARAGGRLDAEAVFFKPSALPADWEKGGLWRDARAIPGVTALADLDGREARRFGAETSGQALLFDERGRLLYRGGLTGGRGHFGENAGREAVLALASGAAAARAETPVFGCSLLSPAPERTARRGKVQEWMRMIARR